MQKMKISILRVQEYLMKSTFTVTTYEKKKLNIESNAMMRARLKSSENKDA